MEELMRNLFLKSYPSFTVKRFQEFQELRGDPARFHFNSDLTKLNQKRAHKHTTQPQDSILKLEPVTGMQESTDKFSRVYS